MLRPDRTGVALWNVHEELVRTRGHLPRHNLSQAAAEPSGQVAHAKEPEPCRHSAIPDLTTTGRDEAGMLFRIWLRAIPLRSQSADFRDSALVGVTASHRLFFADR